MMQPNNTFLKKADLYAKSASLIANKGYRAKIKLNALKTRLSELKRIANREPVVLFTFLFFASVLAEIFSSMDIYRDISSKNISYFDGDIAAYVFIAVIVLIGASSGHYLAPLFGRNIKELEEENISKIDLIEEEIKEKLQGKRRNSIQIGIILGVSVLAIVFLLSQSRINSMQIINQTSDYEVIDLILPVFFVAMEIYSGTYLRTVISGIIASLKIKQNARGYKNALRNYQGTATKALSCYSEIQENGCIKISKELSDVFYRHENRSVADEDYLSPVEAKIEELPETNGLTTKEGRMAG